MYQESGDEVYRDVPMQRIAKSLFSRHGSLWARQSLRSQLALQRKAQVHAAGRTAALRDEHHALETERQLLMDRMEARQESV